jgi:hypothetical protein
MSFDVDTDDLNRAAFETREASSHSLRRTHGGHVHALVSTFALPHTAHDMPVAPLPLEPFRALARGALGAFAFRGCYALCAFATFALCRARVREDRAPPRAVVRVRWGRVGSRQWLRGTVCSSRGRACVRSWWVGNEQMVDRGCVCSYSY